jgi:hypothetical protein
MKRFNINETEKKSILLMHKSLMKEQVTTTPVVDPDLQKLRDMVKNGCLKNGKIYKLKSTGKYIYRAISKTGKQINFFADETYEVIDPTNNKKIKNGRFDCAAAIKTKTQTDDFKATASKQQIDAEGWMTYDEAKAANINLTDPKYFEQKNINGTEYFRKRGIIQGGAGSQEQKNVIDFLTNRYGARFQSKLNQSPQGFCWAFQGEQPLVEPQWTSEKVVGGDAYGVKEGLEIFVSPECLSKIRQASKDVVSTESGYRKIDNDTCKDFLKNYMEAYENGVDATTTAFTQMKKDVQSCKRKFCSKNISKTQGKCEGSWKLGLMGGSRKMDDIIDFFSGENNSIGTSPERTNPYRIA